jgi:hypothetical protein
MDEATQKLAERLEKLPTYVFKQIPTCFFNVQYGHPSSSRYNEIFGENSRKSILGCTAKEVSALSELTGIACSELIFEFGMGMDRLRGTQINELLKNEGMVAAPVVHPA